MLISSGYKAHKGLIAKKRKFDNICSFLKKRKTDKTILLTLYCSDLQSCVYAKLLIVDLTKHM
jgi:hypothetical protein